VGKPSACKRPQPTTSPTGSGGTEADELLEELLEILELELLLEELLDEERLELELDEIEVNEDELDEELLLELDERLDEIELVVVDFAIEHSLVPPETLVPAPKVTSPQIKLPLNSLKVNLSARP
jgi:signal transduction histidine kinase